MATPPRQPFLTIEPRRSWLEIRPRELWQYRDLLVTLAWRDVAVHYKQTVLGAAWAVIQPLAGMLVFTVVFSRLAKLPTNNLPAPLFYYAGLLAWTFFAQTVSGASQSLLEGSRLITKVYFPRILIPFSACGYTLLNLLISTVLLVGLMLYYQNTPTLSILYLPLLFISLLLTATGVGVLIAAWNVKYRDFRYVVPFMLQLWMFASPVVYSVSLIPERWRMLAALNPLVGVIEGFRNCLLGREVDFTLLGISGAVSGVTFVVGLAFFRRVEDDMADLL